MTNLSILDELPTAAQVYSQGAAESLIQKIKNEISSYVPDISTKRGRDEIASIAYRLAKTKTALDNLGKDLTEEWKSQSKKVDNERKRIRDELDKLKDDFRAPLTNYENAEKDRLHKHETKLASLALLSIQTEFSSSSDIEQKINEIKNEQYNWEEFEDRGNKQISNAIAGLEKALSIKKQQESDAFELDLRRKQDEEKATKEREEKIAEDAANKVLQDIANKEKLEKEQEELRLKNTEHKKRINNEAYDSLTELNISLTDGQKKEIIKAIALGKVPHVSIRY